MERANRHVYFDADMRKEVVYQANFYICHEFAKRGLDHLMLNVLKFVVPNKQYPHLIRQGFQV